MTFWKGGAGFFSDYEVVEGRGRLSSRSCRCGGGRKSVGLVKSERIDVEDGCSFIRYKSTNIRHTPR